MSEAPPRGGGGGDAPHPPGEIVAAIGSVTPTKVPFDPEPGRERLRGWFAAALILLLFVVIALAFALFLLSPRPVGELTDFLIIVIPPVTSLVSAVVGFYYGSSTRGRD